ncbi:MAG: hypothetical protein LC667_16935 [Thioalkalivibrio sp.]|nr:hypothetical protein [Thioalkalivibrio sp.]
MRGARFVCRGGVSREGSNGVAHLMNLLSAVTMPLHQLDYFDEDPEDRATG